ncbi:FMN-binding protein [Desulfopila inferna]|uniref:FMN-binding protein n=1 Tax=Desulfopila inferna TaxID=468528 RepID=UPI001965B6AA|nr:FMN-binding protein [Desulfopila inferna]MBM9606349.1 FMN-binding protein [Desulfopila inferna]
MKEMLTIVFRLTLSCILAATVMGVTFVFTNEAKIHNEHLKEERVAFSLLGFQDEVPESVEMNTIYRYVVSRGGEQSIGYLLPGGEQASSPFVFLEIDLNGNLAAQSDVDIDREKVREDKERDSAIASAIGPGKDFRLAEKFQTITDDGERAAYLLSGKFPGFKTHIAVMLALRTDFTLIGFEVLEHEEDPGLGAEIEQPFFKNQFKGKPYEVIKGLDVVKAPIPTDYMEALEMDLPPEDIAQVMEKYRGQDIYALTGATISTVAVTDGIKAMVRKFAYRINILDSVVDTQNISVSF